MVVRSNSADLRKRLDNDQARLYDLIWKRAVASQMRPAEFERTTIGIEAREGSGFIGLRATGTVVVFPGFIKAYTEGRDEPGADDDERRLPKVNRGDPLTREAVTPSRHFTEPPPRYTEATLIRKMEELGIGRPSTYAATLSTLEDRDYVTIDKKRLVPGSKGRIVTAFLENFFERYVGYSFTADLEEKLDAISDGRLGWRSLLREFWAEFSRRIGEVMDVRTAEVLDALNEELAPLIFPAKEDGGDPRVCPLCAAGRLSLKNGRYGAFIGCSNYPDCSFTRQLGDDPNAPPQANRAAVLGVHPDLSREISLKSGRFGPYIEMAAQDGEKPRRASLPKGWTPQDMTLDKAIRLIDLPRPVGDHPETKMPIMAGLGRYGPFLKHDGKYARLESVDDVFEVGLNRAVALIAEQGDKSRSSRTPAALRTLGDHPDGGAVTVRDGRHGPYVNHGKVNATLPKDADPQAVTIDEALALIEAKVAKGGGTKAAKKPAAKIAADRTKTWEKSRANSGTKKSPAKGAAKPAAGAKTASAKSKAKAAAPEEPPF